MWDFKPSPDLTRTIVKDMRSTVVPMLEKHGHTGAAIAFRERYEDIEEVRELLCGRFIECVVSEARRAQYGIKTASTESLQLIVNGKFTEYLAGALADNMGISVIEIGRTNYLMELLAEEFIEWLNQRNNHTEGFGPRHPISRFVVKGDNVSCDLRPLDPPFEDPDFVEATDVE